MMIQSHQIWSHVTFATEVSKVQQDFAGDRQPRFNILLRGFLFLFLILHYVYFQKSGYVSGSKFVGFLLNCLITCCMQGSTNLIHCSLAESATTSPHLVEAWKLPAYLYTQTSSQVQLTYRCSYDC